MTNQEIQVDEIIETKVKPLLRGWFHAVAAVAAVILTIVLCWYSRADVPRFLSLLVFGLSMIEMYTVSAIYHIVHWEPQQRRIWRSLDHANIFVLIAGTYTPLCFNILSGWVRIVLLITIWLLALAGVIFALFPYALRLPKWFSASLYILMGWIVILALPAFLQVLPWSFIFTLLSGGILYTIGAVVYATRWPNPFPKFFGYHEIFHLFVIAGSISFVASVWIWALHFPRV
ncbi:PAQR family membrane homeostasis protein TrhA [Dictyobacter arantiisoli]|uniref:DNA-binding protein n=1 Tax=Dictyobacter arantiisoli TaxID=2014874 RepID=A0A5A5THF2_9CHLR|nr:hemolysin III family protein [Dictyobacter arantiisoli]GCF10665.1 DNA-binding protein [Dictyobacter arantiisoli]